MKKKLFRISVSIFILVLLGCRSPSPEHLEEIVESSLDVSIEAEQAAQISTQVPVATLPPPVVASATPLLPTATSIPPTIAPTLEPTETNVEVVPTVADSGESTETDSNDVVFGRTPEGAFFYGSPAAEITLIDYSEFL